MSTWLVALLVGALLFAELTLGSWTSQATADTRPQNAQDPSTPATVSDDALPAPQINGVIWTQAMIGNTVYAGGSFTNARPAGSAAGVNTVARGNILAFDVTTGVLTSFAPAFNAQVRSITVSPDKTRIYVGGEFTTVNGQSRRRIAAFNASTGALIPGFAPSVNYDVDAVVATNDKVFVGGAFLGVGNADRQYLAAFNASSGALLDWAPQATGGQVNAMTINPQGTKIVVGGSFTALNGSSNPGYGLGMVDATTGAILPFAINSVVRNGTVDGAITTLSTDGTYVYGGGYTFGKSGGTWEGTFAASWNAGEIHWLNDCHGDTYGVQPIGSVVYQVGHAHYCDNIDGVRQGAGGVGDYPYYRATAMSRAATGVVTYEPDQGRYYNFAGQPAPAWLGWYPEINAGTYTGQSQGAWSITGNSDYIVAAGEFTRVNGASQQGLVRFAVSSKAANKSGPKLFNASYPLNVSSTAAGKVRVNWLGNNDDDNEYLDYKVYRDTQSATGLVHTIEDKRIRRWESITMGFTDSGVSPGSHQYRVVVSDPFGNSASSAWTSVTVPASGANSDYLEAVYNSQPSNYWRLGDAVGTAASADRVGNMPLSATGATPPVRGTAGAIVGDGDTASTFTGGVNTSWTASTVQHQAPDVFSVETWFKTTSTTGGRLVGWSNRNTQGNSAKHDRQIYMDSTGKLHFGAQPTNLKQVVSSTNAYNNGDWHHAVGTLSKNGLKLYVDGAEVAARNDVTYGQHLNIGYWRVGGDTLSGWPNATLPTQGFFSGALDEIAVYKKELTSAEVAAHYAAAGQGNPPANVAPVAAFTSTTDDLKVSVDGSGSADSDGSVAGYVWTFQGGGTATGATASHTFAAAGEYDVTLKVTDDDGATDTVTKKVTVTAAPPANVAPVAAFTSTTDDLKVSVDGSGSADSDGSVAGYAWTFQGGGTATGATASHTFAAAGEYDVTLKVTDDDGATDTLTKKVTVTAAEAPPIAADLFTRTASSGWGSADTGGAWTRSGTATNYAVANGVGTMRMGTAGSGPSMALNSVSSTDTEVSVTVGVDKAATGGGTYTTVRPRIRPLGDRYYADTRFVAGGTVSLTLGRNVGSTETALQTRTVTGLTVAPGDRLNVKVQSFGTSPTTFRAKVWKVGSTEPTIWTASVTDSSTSLQGPGAIGLGTYLSGSATNAPVVASFDNLRAVSPPN